MSKLFDIAGVSRVRAGYALKFRVANGKPARRARTLERAGCVDIQLFQIEPMSKDEAYAWFCKEHPALAAEVKGKVASAEKPAKAVKIAAKSKPVAEKPAKAQPEKVEVVDAALSPAAKLALKRAKDAARKREKRAAEKAAKVAVAA